MIAYNNQWLRNLSIKKEMEDAVGNRLVSPEEYERIVSVLPVGFYTPNTFIRIGLFVLTLVISLFSCGIFFIGFASGSDSALGSLTLFLGVLAYLALEIIIRKNHYHSGVDDCLLYMSLILVGGGLCWMMDTSLLEGSVIFFVISGFFSLRFANSMMAVLSSVSFLGIVVFVYDRLAIIHQLGFFLALLPFVGAVLILSGKKWNTVLYEHCISAIHLSTLVSFYAIGNIFLINHLPFLIKYSQPTRIYPFFFGFWWVWTILLPILYVVRGLIRKDPSWYRTGLLLIPAALLTVRYYYPILAPEIALILAGAILTVVAGFLIRRLKTPKHGFTSEEITVHDRTGLEALAFAGMANAMHPNQPPSGTTEFGGGSGGGGGAGGDF